MGCVVIDWESRGGDGLTLNPVLVVTIIGFSLIYYRY